MPSGHVHIKASLKWAIPCFFIGIVFSISYANGFWQILLAGVLCSLGCILGIFLTPDLDQESIGTSEYWIIKYTMGLGFLWAMLWYPYARLCKHRSFWSHCPVIGTLGRLAYISIIIGIITIWWKPLHFDYLYVVWIALGLIVSDAAHWYMDWRSGEHEGAKK